jgi:Uri superfamily endonuclease
MVISIELAQPASTDDLIQMSDILKEFGATDVRCATHTISCMTTTASYHIIADYMAETEHFYQKV